MVSYSTLARLAHSELMVEELGLERTAGRLGALRRHMERFKHLSDEDKARDAYWALAKLEDTKACLVQELCSNKREIEHQVSSARMLSAITKAVTYLVSMGISGQVLQDMIARDAEPPIMALVVGAASVAVYCLKRVIEAMTGAERYNDAVKAVDRTIGECRHAVSRYAG